MSQGFHAMSEVNSNGAMNSADAETVIDQDNASAHSN